MAAKGRLRTVSNGHTAYCQGCQEYHLIPNTWQFDGNYDDPTFSPSLLVRGYSEQFKADFVCHSYIANGQWQFLGDCTHILKDQTVALRNEERNGTEAGND